MRRLQVMRRFIVLTLGLAGVGIVVTAALAIAMLLLINPFAGFDGKKEFTAVPGTSAKSQMNESWPPDVDTASVKSVSLKTEWTRDSYSTWFCIELPKGAAGSWAKFVHNDQERNAKECLGAGVEFAEGVHRRLVGPPP
jgi:hypothetical protein